MLSQSALPKELIEKNWDSTPRSHRRTGISSKVMLGLALASGPTSTHFYNPMEKTLTSSGVVQYNQNKAKDWKQFFHQAILFYDDNPVEDGISHISEQLILKAFEINNSEVLSAIRLLVFDENNNSIKCNILKTIGRIDIGGLLWKKNVIQSALSSNDVNIRDAAIQLVENWQRNELAELLRNHREETIWLRQYADMVVEEILG